MLLLAGNVAFANTRSVATMGDPVVACVRRSMAASFPGDSPPISGELLIRQCEACLTHDTADRLREIQHRTLVVCGRRDALTPPRFHRELADEIPNAHLVTMGYGGHIVMVESAPHFNRAVLQFLSDGRSKEADR